MLKSLRVGWRQFAADPRLHRGRRGGPAVALAACFLVAQIVFNEVLPDPEVPDAGQVVTWNSNTDIWAEDGALRLRPRVAPGRRAGERHRALLDGASFSCMPATARAAGLRVRRPDLVDILGLRSSAGDLRAALSRPDAIALTEDSARAVPRRRRARQDGARARARARGGRRGARAAAPARQRRRRCSRASTRRPPRGRGDAQRLELVAGQHLRACRTGLPAGRRRRHGAGRVRAGPGHDARPRNEHKDIKIPTSCARRRCRASTCDGAQGTRHAMLLLGMGGGAALMLGLALANYVNLTSVRTLARAREIAVRKTLAPSPWRLTAQFVVRVDPRRRVAAALGLLLAWWVAPAIGSIC